MKKKGRPFGWAFRKANGSWAVRYRQDGRTVERVAGSTKKEARAFLRKVAGDVEKAKHLERMGIIPVKKATLAEVWEAVRSVRAARLSERGLRVEEAAVQRAARFFGNRFTCDLKVEDVGRFIVDLARQECGPATRNRHLASLGPVFAEAVTRGFCRVNPCRGVKRFKEELKPVPFIGEGDIDRLLSFAPAGLRPAIALLADTGLRRGELLDLEWPAVDLSRGVLTVRKSKNGRPREVPLTARAVTMLESLRAGRVVPLSGADPVFSALLQKERKPWARREVVRPGTDRERCEARLSVEFRRVAKRAGFPGLSLHSLRHSFCSRLVSKGVALNVVAALAGHLTLAVTSRYSRHAPTDAGRLAIRALESTPATVPSTEPRAVKVGG